MTKWVGEGRPLPVYRLKEDGRLYAIGRANVPLFKLKKGETPSVDEMDRAIDALELLAKWVHRENNKEEREFYQHLLPGRGWSQEEIDKAMDDRFPL